MRRERLRQRRAEHGKCGVAVDEADIVEEASPWILAGGRPAARALVEKAGEALKRGFSGDELGPPSRRLEAPPRQTLSSELGRLMEIAAELEALFKIKLIDAILQIRNTQGKVTLGDWHANN